MIRILDRLVALSFLKAFVAFILASPVLFILGDVTENLDDYLSRGLTWAEVAEAYLFMLPQFIEWSFPIAALVGAVFTVQSMTTHREIVAAKAGGISFHRLTAPLLVLGLLLTGMALGLGEIVPRGNRIAAEILKEREGRRDWRANFVFQAQDGRNLAVRRLNVRLGTLQGVTLEEVDPRTGLPRSHLMAERATWNSETGWTFEQGYLRLFPAGTREVVTLQFDALRERELRERPEDLLEAPRSMDEMTYAELGHLAENIVRSGGDPRKVLVSRAQKLAIPAATLVIILFGAPLATSSKRGGATYGIGVALLSTILYLLLFKIFAAAGKTGAVPPFPAAWAPNFIFLAAGLVLLKRVRT